MGFLGFLRVIIKLQHKNSAHRLTECESMDFCFSIDIQGLIAVYFFVLENWSFSCPCIEKSELKYTVNEEHHAEMICKDPKRVCFLISILYSTYLGNTKLAHCTKRNSQCFSSTAIYGCCGVKLRSTEVFDYSIFKAKQNQNKDSD